MFALCAVRGAHRRSHGSAITARRVVSLPLALCARLSLVLNKSAAWMHRRVWCTGRFRVQLQEMGRCRGFCGCKFRALLGKRPGARLLGHVGRACLVVQETPTVFRVTAPFCIPTAGSEFSAPTVGRMEPRNRAHMGRGRHNGRKPGTGLPARGPGTGRVPGSPPPRPHVMWASSPPIMGGGAEQVLMGRADRGGLSAAGSDPLCMAPEGKDRLCLPQTSSGNLKS